MKKIFKSMMFLAAAATAFTACNKEADIQETGKTGEMETLRFYAVVNDAETKATLTTEDEKTFKAAWEEGDKMDIEVSGNGHGDYLFSAIRKGSYFEFAIPSDWTEEGTWSYGAYYPSKTGVSFGADRVQNGSNYASQYDVMLHENSEFKNSKCGYDSEGGHIVLPMSRVTSILYFHLTSDLEETLQSATLTVEGGDIAAETLTYDDSEIKFVASEDSQTFNTITLTFEEGKAPSAKDFCLWYNILPVDATGLTLTVTTTSGKTATLTNSKGKTYVAGKLNKVVKNGLTWEEGVTPTVGEPYVWTLRSGDLGETGSPASSVTKGSPELTWTAAYTWGEDADRFFGWDANYGRGVQIGKGSEANKCTSAIFSTTGYADYIESVKISFAHASNGGSSASVKVGDVDLVCGENTSVDGTTSAEYYVFTSDELVSGDVVITLSNSAAKAIYLKSIEINPDKRSTQTLSFPEVSYSVELSEGTFTSPTLSGAMTDVTYASENETVATVDNTGLVTLLKEGSTTITATAAESDEYQSGSASYSLTVTAGPSSIADVIAAANNDDVYTQGVVAQVNAKGFIITDGTNNLFVYQNATPSVVVGQSVKVTGTRGTYYNVPQIASPTITKGASGQEVVRTALTTVTSANATGFTSSEYVSLTGELSISDNHYNIVIDGSTTKGSLYQVVTSATYTAGKLADLNGTVIKVTGYVSGSSDSYLNIAVVDIESMPYLSYTEPGDAGFAENSQVTIPVNANVGWTAAKGTDEDGIIKGVTYDSEKVTVTFNANADDVEKTATVVITPDSESGLSAVEVTVKQKKYSEVAETKTYQHIFTAKPSVSNNVTLSGVNWNIAATNLGSYNSGNYAGVQIGSSKNDGSITLTSSSSWNYEEKTRIKEVRLWLNLGGTSVTPTVSVGGVAAVSDGTTVVKNSNAGNDYTKATKVTFTPAANGDTGVVVINVETVKAGYICAIEIDCE